MDLKKCRLLVTPTSYGRDDPSLRTELEEQVGEVIYNPTGKPLSSKEVIQLLPCIDGYIAGLDQIDRAAMESANQLKVIARYGVGVDRVDLETAHKRGIVITNTPGANSASVAELALALMLILARQIPQAIKAVRKGEWPRLPGISLENKSIGILGFGAIGKRLAQRLEGFLCRVIAHDPFIDERVGKSLGVEIVEIDKLAKESDFLIIHIPLSNETKEIVNKSFLAKMKKGAFLINTSRGEVLNEDDLLEALQSEQLSGAALDAFVEEPPDIAHPLLSLPQVITTPHLGAQTDGATRNMGWMAMRDCLAVLKGEKPTHRVV